jgi:hypothetical protein
VPANLKGHVLAIGGAMHEAFFGPVLAQRRAWATVAEVRTLASAPCGPLSVLKTLCPRLLLSHQLSQKKSAAATRAAPKALARAASASGGGRGGAR